MNMRMHYFFRNYFLSLLLLIAVPTISVAQAVVVLDQRKDACDGLFNGSIRITVTSGTTPLSYFIIGINFGANFSGPLSVGTPLTVSGLRPDNYFIIVNDGDPAPNYNSVFTIGNVVTPLSLSLDPGFPVDNSSCTSPDGQISVTASGGSGSYTFAWTGPGGFTSSSEDLTGLAGGTYNLTLIDNNSNCVRNLAPVNITDPSPVLYSISPPLAKVVCTGNDLFLTLNGSEPGVSYEVRNGATLTGITQIGTGGPLLFTVPWGTFSGGDLFTIVGTNGFCTPASMTGVVDVTISPLPTAVLSGGGAVCFGDPLPNVTFTFTGTAPFTFTYTDGTTPVTVNNHPTNTFTINNAPVGNYTVTALSDANACVGTNLGSPIAVSQTPLPTAVISGGGPACSGSPLPNVTFTFTGAAPFTFTYTDGTTPVTVNNHPTTSFTLTNAPVGTYSITALTDGNSCNATNLGTPVVVSVNPLPTVSSVVGGGTVCAGAPLPNVTFTFTGTAPFTFTYTNGVTPVTVNNHPTNTFTLSNAPAGTYSVTALTDGNTCVATSLGGNVSVVVNPLPTASISGGGTVCSGSPLPNVTFTFTGTAPFTFTYTDGVTPVTVNNHPTASFTLTNAPVGTYSITALSDATTCIATALGTPVSVVVSPLPTVASVTGGGTVCAGDPLPDVTFTFTGTAPFTFTYTDGVTPVTVNNHPTTTFTISNAPAGTYSVTALTDATTCPATVLGGNVSVVVNPLPTASISGGGTVCSGSPLPNVTFTFTGTAPFTFTYTDGVTPVTVNNHPTASFTLTNAPVGTYSITALSDATTCTATALGTPVSVVVSPLPTVASVTGGGTVCAGDPLPDVTFTFTGTAPFTFTYTDGVTPVTVNNHPTTTFTISNAPAGTYSVTALTDATTCPATVLGGNVSVVVNPLPTASISGGGTVCSGNPLPNVTFTFTGTAPFTFTYTDGVTPVTVNNHPTASFTITNAPAGTYSITALSDATTCIATALGTPVNVVVSPAPAVASVTGGGTVCAGDPLPDVIFTFTGTAPFTFTYTDGVTPVTVNNHPTTTFTISNAPAGTYSVTALTDATTCPATVLGGNAGVVVNPLPTASISGGGTVCSGDPLPNVTFNFTGTAPFTFTYTDGVTPVTVNNHPTASFTLTNAPAGTYSITALSDASTCAATTFGTPVSVVENPTPALFVVSGGGSYCTGSPVPLNIGLSGSEVGINYTLVRDGVTNVETIAGTGGVLAFTAQTAAGTYTVSASNATTTCLASMTGSAIISVDPLPVVFNVTGGGAACQGSPGVAIGLSGSEIGVDYTLVRDGVTNVEVVAGTGGALSFTAQTTAGTYTVVAANATTLCQSNMTGNANVVIDPAPEASVSGGGTVCTGQPLPNVVFTFTGTAPFNFTYSDGVTSVPIAGHPTGTFTITNAPAGIYSITSLTDATACPGTVFGSSVAVVVNAAATVNAGPPQTICSGEDVILDGTIGGPLPNGTWSGGTGTFLPNNTTIDATYTPSAAERLAGTVTLRLTTADPDAGGPCISVFDEVTITITPGPNAGPDQVICAGADVILSGSVSGGASVTWTGGSGTFNPDANSLTATYTPSAAEVASGLVTLTLNAAGVCAAITDDITITINPAATADAGADQIICTGDDVNLSGTVGGSATSGTWSGGTGTFNPDPSTLNAVYTPSAAEITGGVAVLRLTTDDPDGAGPCTAAFDEVTISISSAAVAVAGADQTICANGTATMNGSFSGASSAFWATLGDGTFNDINNPVAQYTPGPNDIAAGSVVLRYTTVGPCAPATDDVLITIVPAANVDAGPAQTICSGSTIVLAGSFSGSATGIIWTTSGDGSFSDNTDVFATYTPGANDRLNGTVDLTITATGSCTGIFEVVTMTIDPAATVSAGPDITVCATGGVPLGGSLGGAATSITWTTSGTGTFNNATLPNAIYTPSATDISNGTVTLTITSNNPAGPCPAVSDALVITFSPVPGDEVTFGTDTWIGYVYTDASAPAPPTSNIDFSTPKYRGYIDETDIAVLGLSIYNTASDAFDLNLSNSFNLSGPNVCGSYSDDYSIRFKMQKDFPAGIYQFVVGSDDGVRLIIDGTNVLPASSFVLRSFRRDTATVCLGAGTHDVVIEYFERGGFSRVSFDYNVVPLPSAPSPVAVCVGSPTAPTLTVSIADPNVTGFNWYSDAGLTNLVGTGSTFTPTVGTGSGELDLSTVAATDYFVTGDYGACETSAQTVTVDVVGSATINTTDTTVCEAAGVVDLTNFATASPAGGVFSFTGHPNITGNTFDPSGLSGPISINVDYAIGACAATTEILVVTVTNSASVGVPPTALGICQTSPAIDLTTVVMGTPAGGTFSFAGNGVTGNTFDPAGLTGIQTITVEYNIGGAGGCDAPTQTFDIAVSPNATLTTSNTIVCPSAGNVNLTTLASGSPVGGTFVFTGPGVSGNFFNPASFAGTVQNINVGYTATGCATANGTIQITVRAANDPLCGGGGSNCTNFAAIVPLIVTLPTCNDRDAGEISFTIARANGTPSTFRVTLSYNGSNQVKFTSGTVNFDDLKSGLYQYTVVDEGNGQQCGPADFFLDLETQVEILDKQKISDVTCFGGTDGNYILSVDGTTTGEYWFTYVLDGLESSPQQFTPGAPLPGGLPADNDPIIIKVDQSPTFLCPDTAVVMINHLFPEITYNVSALNVQECNGDDGELTVSAITGGNTSGGALQIRLRKEDLATPDPTDYFTLVDYADVSGATATFSNLTQGNYIIDVLDNSDCRKSVAAIIGAPGAIAFNVFKEADADCTNDAKSGRIRIQFLQSGNYLVGIGTSQVVEPTNYQAFNYVAGDPDLTVDTLARGNYYVFVKPASGVDCPSVRSVQPIMGAYAVSFQKELVCDLGGIPQLNLIQVTGDPSASIRVQVFRSGNAGFAVDDFTVPFDNVIPIVFSESPLEHAFLAQPDDYFIRLSQVQPTCGAASIESNDQLHTVTAPLKIVVSETSPSLPEPRRTGSILLKTVLGGSTFADENGPFYMVSLIDPASNGVIEGPVQVRRNNQGNYERLFEEFPIGTYRISVEDASGCEADTTAVIPVDTSIIIPNVFTPNNDAINDFFEIVNLPAGKHELVVSNRWGTKVFFSGDYNEDNFWGGEDVPEGVYFYVLRLEGGEVMNGWVEIMRGARP